MTEKEFFGGVTRPDKDIERDSLAGCGCLTTIAAALAAIVLMLITCGCKTIEVTKEVPVITEHTTVQHHTDIVRDTLYQRDSVYHYINGDTVIIERWHQAVNINKVVVADTIRDTIPKVVTVTEVQTKEVEKQLTKWQSLKMKAGGFAIGLLIAALLGAALWAFLKLKKKIKL